MDKTIRKRIGILLVSDDIGVVYYLLSVIKSLHFLDDNDKPEIMLFYADNCAQFTNLFKYDYLSCHRISYNKNKKLKYLGSILLQKNLFIDAIIKEYKTDGLFPLMDPVIRNNNAACVIASWIPDFQHKFYPAFFSKTNLIMREARFKKIIDKCDAIALSSKDACSHLKRFYTINEARTRIQVMPFVSMIQDLPLTNYTELAERYKITIPYFLVSNQFYAHKNHMVVLNAIKDLKSKGHAFTVFLTGKTEDYRNPQFFSTLTGFIKEYNLDKEARILGLIPREDQLGLLKNSLAIIQPSKFEGWSTIIEDAKTLQQQVICSDISVHLEQMGDKAYYFNPDKADELSALMQLFISGKIQPKPFFENYQQRVKEFGSRFVNMFAKG